MLNHNWRLMVVAMAMTPVFLRIDLVALLVLSLMLLLLLLLLHLLLLHLPLGIGLLLNVDVILGGSTLLLRLA